jgi:hypothetical protein
MSSQTLIPRHKRHNRSDHFVEVISLLLITVFAVVIGGLLAFASMPKATSQPDTCAPVPIVWAGVQVGTEPWHPPYTCK